ncbi:NAD(P)H-hydrate epimerase [Arenibacter sp. GZD96]|uniref:NAD(P)H-hydrate epimerase n=1 Tax=Aurantibrevibacter litoralis TaxID=3106030 RepID=UPI002AFFE50C|nr:NAD(P)H-hydrate epimerase [Arenibacter sp. GZD-96]MEA1786729.1 NAD(P)H-hydrate epimerase [Arenibacter sp. GZD-96]
MIPHNHFNPSETLSLEAFKEMDYLAVTHYGLHIELMMENAGLQLARLIAEKASFSTKIRIGVGNGNNGGGGLVAARRLSAWGFKVYLDLAVTITKALPLAQLKRALAFGATKKKIKNPDIWVDAYLGFSQRLPLAPAFLKGIDEANACKAYRIALDLPTGISENGEGTYFKAHQILTLAAPKAILNTLPLSTDIRIADLGIPKPIYDKFHINMPHFYTHQIVSGNKTKQNPIYMQGDTI